MHFRFCEPDSANKSSLSGRSLVLWWRQTVRGACLFSPVLEIVLRNCKENMKVLAAEDDVGFFCVVFLIFH